MTKLDLDKIRDLIRTEDDAAVLQEKLRAMVEEAHPVAAPLFANGEVMPMHQFLSRFQEKLCDGVVPRFYECPVTVIANEQNRLVIEISPIRKGT